MLDSLQISQLYENILEKDCLFYNLSPESIQFGIECMAHVYKGETVGLSSVRSKIADYTDPAHRCAYLHKYAALHTAMVRDMLCQAIRENFGFFHRLLFTGEQFKICSIGGGPGTDIIGALSALHAAFSYFDASVTVVDYMAEWSYSFESILRELGTGMYGAFGNNISYYLSYQYVGANLLKSFKPEVVQALSTASLVTMIKFTSAAACKDTYSMIKNIFANMKPGGVLLFIDNDGGGFHKLIMDAATEFDFLSIFGPLRRENYFNDFCRKKRFGYTSCFKTTVTVHVLQKPVIMNPYDIFPNAYASPPYMLQNRRVILENNRPSLLGSPPTPFLYLGESSYINDANPCMLENRRILLENNYRNNKPSLLDSPPTPFLYLGKSPDINANFNYSQDENISRPGFLSPAEEIPQSPYMQSAVRVATPLNHNAHRGRKRAHTPGCFPLRINNFRHHVAKKVDKFKARARSVFKKKNKKEKIHPIFKL